MKIHEMYVGGGCFWCTEAVFDTISGVISVVPGYAGGTTESPTYDEVVSGTTGHTEVVKVEYNPETVTYKELLTIFFATHDPATPNRQGSDVGTQYRSIILTLNEDQEKKAREMIEDLESVEEGNPVVTEVVPLEHFYEAEEYHHDFYKKHPEKAYCQVVISPKIKKVQEEFQKLMKQQS